MTEVLLDDKELRAAARALRRAWLVTVLTGAGASAESGIDTFRDPDGLWERYPAEQFATLAGLTRTAVLQPRRLTAFVTDVLGPLARAAPNAGHRAIARLEQHVQTTVVTQNIDGLHTEAGSSYVREVHGSMLEVVTLSGRQVRRLSRADLGRICQALQQAARRSLTLLRVGVALRPLLGISPRWGVYRPSVVLFGEPLREPAWQHARKDTRQCDVMLVIGTSAMVMPAAELPLWARRHGATVIVVDPAPERPTAAGIHLRGKAALVLPRLVAAAFAEPGGPGEGQAAAGQP
jgi:NAD-dependent deacetylase